MRRGRRACLRALFWAVAAPYLGRNARAQGDSPFVAFLQDTTANDYRAAQVVRARQWFAHFAPHVRFTVFDAGASVLLQLRDFEKAIEQGARVILLGAGAGKPLLPLLAQAREKKVRIVGIGRKIPGAAYDTLIETDNRQIGEMAARFLFARRPQGGKVAMLEGLPASSAAQERRAGFLGALAQMPQWRLVASEPAHYLRHRAAQVVERWLSEGVRFDALYAHSDSMLDGALWALKRHGMALDRMLTIGIDYIAAARRAILAGEQTASFLYPLHIEEACQAAMSWLHHDHAPARILVPTHLITRENATRIAAIF